MMLVVIITIASIMPLRRIVVENGAGLGEISVLGKAVRQHARFHTLDPVGRDSVDPEGWRRVLPSLTDLALPTTKMRR